MIGKQRSGVFLSYARADGEDFDAMLRERLREKAPKIVVKQDRNLLEGGVGWWKQLTEAIESVEFLVLVMTPSSMQSEMVRKEWRYARQQGVCVYPVKGAPDSELKFSELPRWMSESHFFDIDKEWESFVAHVRKGCDTRRVRKDPVAIATALSGAGGFGKTTLATALCHDEEIIESFDDGILWVPLGQNLNLMGNLVAAYAALTGERPGFENEENAGASPTVPLASRLSGKRSLGGLSPIPLKPTADFSIPATKTRRRGPGLNGEPDIVSRPSGNRRSFRQPRWRQP